MGRGEEGGRDIGGSGEVGDVGWGQDKGRTNRLAIKNEYNGINRWVHVAKYFSHAMSHRSSSLRNNNSWVHVAKVTLEKKFNRMVGYSRGCFRKEGGGRLVGGGIRKKA